jgi:hypothetical protein
MEELARKKLPNVAKWWVEFLHDIRKIHGSTLVSKTGLVDYFSIFEEVVNESSQTGYLLFHCYGTVSNLRGYRSVDKYTIKQ